jgi:hypothetical protein
MPDMPGEEFFSCHNHIERWICDIRGWKPLPPGKSHILEIKLSGIKQFSSKLDKYKN